MDPIEAYTEAFKAAFDQEMKKILAQELAKMLSLQPITMTLDELDSI